MSKLKVNTIEHLSDPNGSIKTDSHLDFQNTKNIINVSGVIAEDVTVLGTLTAAGFAPSGGLTSTGNFNVGSPSVLNVDSSTGNTLISGTLSIADITTVTDTTDSTSKDTGSLILEGGLGVEKAVFIGTDINVGGTSTLIGNVDLRGQLSNSTGDVTINDVTKISDTSASTSSLTGALQVSGGVGIAGALYAGGKIDTASTTSSTTTTSGSITTAGGVGIAENLNVGGTVKLSGTTTSTNATSGVLQISGGVGIAENLNVGTGGTVKALNTTDSTSISTGALQVSGGAGVAKNLYVGETLNTKSITSINEYITAKVGTNNIGTTKFVKLSGNASEVLEVQAISSASDTPLAYWPDSVNAALANSTNTFIKRGIVDSTLTAVAIGDPIYCDASGALSTTSSSFLVGFAATVGVNAKVYLNIGGSGGGSGLIDSYLSYSTISLANNAVDINLGETDSCSYKFFIKQDPRICGDINVLYKGVGIDPDVRVDTNSAKVSIIKGTATSLNIYILSNTIKLENNNLGLGTVDLRLYKFQTT